MSLEVSDVGGKKLLCTGANSGWGVLNGVIPPPLSSKWGGGETERGSEN